MEQWKTGAWWFEDESEIFMFISFKTQTKQLSNRQFNMNLLVFRRKQYGVLFSNFL